MCCVLAEMVLGCANRFGLQPSSVGRIGFGLGAGSGVCTGSPITPGSRSSSFGSDGGCIVDDDGPCGCACLVDFTHEAKLGGTGAESELWG